MEEIVPLIHRAQAGDSEAYGVIVSRFQDMAYGYAYAILNDFHLAQDAAQEAFVEAYQVLPSLREAFAFPAWFKRILHKHCDRLTRGKGLAVTPLEVVAGMASSLPGPAEVAERREVAERMQNAVQALPQEQRVVTALFYISGYSHHEIAGFLEVPAKTVKSRLHASRSRLRKAMVDMVEDELRAHALPPDFAAETVEQAVARAGAFNKEGQFDQAEQLLHQVLGRVPQYPQALKELNRTLMWGRVYGRQRWGLLSELAARGKTILQTMDDEYVHHELAQTLLAIPAMPEAVAFLEDWIAAKGRRLERLGMLAWAKGCVADYATAEALWQDLLALAENAERNEILFHIPFVAYTLVDCFAEAGQLPPARRVARQAWDRCRDLGATDPLIAASLRHHRGFPADVGWMSIFHAAKLDLQEIAQVLLARCQIDADRQTQATALCVRNWVDDPRSVVADWLVWVRERLAAEEYAVLENWRSAILSGPKRRGEWRAAYALAQATWELLGQAGTQEADQHRVYWSWELNPMGAIAAGDWEAAEEIARRQVDERGMQESAWSAILVAAGRGVPTPPELVRAVEQHGVSSVDGYGMYGWYLSAREAAAAGDRAKAFEALRQSLSYWSNPPWGRVMTIWEHDPYWGDLRNHPEFKRAFEERRQRIGPVYGQLHYFPGW